MGNGMAIGAALGSALCFAVSSVLQQRGAARAPRGRGLHLKLLGHLLRRPVWLFGVLAAVGTLALQVLALSSGELVLVQPLLVVGLLFALPLSVLLDRRRPRLHEWMWAALLVAGLLVLLGAAHPTSPAHRPSGDRLWQLGALAVALAVGTALAGHTQAGRHRAVALGAATGVMYGVSAALIKYCAALCASEGLGWLVTSWPPYALLAVGGAGIVLNQAAYQAGPLCGALPAIAITDPLFAVLFGVLALGEHVRTDAGGVVLEGFGAALTALAVYRLAGLSAGRHPCGPQPPVEIPAPRRERVFAGH